MDRRPGGMLAELKAGAPLALLSGVACGLLMYPWDVWYLAPVALTPLLVALRRVWTLRAAAYLTILWACVFSALTLHWMWAIFSTASIALWALLSIPWALFAMAYRHLSRRVAPPVAVWLAPVLFTAAEWLRCEGWYLRFSWNQIGTAYVASEASQSIYPLLGVYGLTFLSVLVAALVAEALLRDSRGERLRGLAQAAGVVTILVLGFRLAWVAGLHPPLDARGARGVRVLMVQAEDEDLGWYLETVRQNAVAKPQLIVWPELATTEYAEQTPAALHTFIQAARLTHAVLVAGCKAPAPERVRCDWLRRRAMLQAAGELYYNTALVIGPDGEVLGRYHKRHPIQFFADGVPGEGYPTFATPLGRIGVAICYDFDFASTARRLTQNGAQLLVVPTYDARSWGTIQQMQHARLALARAAEVGRYVVRPTSSGVSQIIAPGGEQVTCLPQGSPSHTTGYVELHSDRTVYVAATWRLAQVCALLSLMALAWSVVARRRAGAGGRCGE